MAVVGRKPSLCDFQQNCNANKLQKSLSQPLQGYLYTIVSSQQFINLDLLIILVWTIDTSC